MEALGRPFEIHSATSNTEVLHMLKTSATPYLGSVDIGMADLVRNLLVYDAAKRISTLNSLQAQPYLKDMNFDLILARKIKPSFIPPKDHLNCDPTYELEEMIIESKPLHKKKKRLAKRNSKREKEQSLDNQQEVDPVQESLDNLDKQFTNYNRERDLSERNHAQTTEVRSDKSSTSSSHPLSSNSQQNDHPESESKDQNELAVHQTSNSLSQNVT
ncbi:hypothetical protein LSH36_1336g00004 [Paralvinella palmiformis]|uniref:Uncharacterized protein n=1 Tax=Paralvinella palmiformis TaxID=53620 RepID=A0AAD9MQL1_9ANNE|nr:hypothetical protein LSH36_1336g00004 [Paralvinella palmiformis]